MQMHKSLMLTAGALLLFGAGCAKFTDQVAQDAVAPLEQSAEALRKAKELSVEQEAAAKRQEESESPDVHVALIRTAAPDDSPPFDEDAIGCGDHVEMVPLHRVSTSGDTVRDAVATLLALKESSLNGLYNSLAQSTLTVEDVRSPDGVTTEVRLKGEPRSGGACDNPRIKAQIERTVARFRPKYRIVLNGSEANWRCLGDQSGECK